MATTKTKKEALQEYATTGQSFVESFNNVRAAVMGMGGRPTAIAFREVQNHASDLSAKAAACAALCDRSEGGEKLNPQDFKFAPTAIDPTAKQV